MSMQYKRIFAALDGAKTQEMVAERAIELAASEHADLLFGHVVDSVPYQAAGTDFAALAMDMKEKLEDSLGDMLEAARNNPDIPSVGVVVKAGRVTRDLERGAHPAVRSRFGHLRRARPEQHQVCVRWQRFHVPHS